jgi:hypothetical protein
VDGLDEPVHLDFHDFRGSGGSPQRGFVEDEPELLVGVVQHTLAGEAVGGVVVDLLYRRRGAPGPEEGAHVVLGR